MNRAFLQQAQSATVRPAPGAVSTPAVAVDEIKRINKGSLRAFATVTIAGKLTIHSVRIVQQEGQTAWVSMPQNEVKSQDGGKSKYYPIVEVTDDKLKEQISTAVLTAWRARA